MAARIGFPSQSLASLLAMTEAAAGDFGLLPDAVAQFYQRGDGMLIPEGVSIYPLADLAERNQTFEIADYCPGFLLVGDDSGGRGFLVRLNTADPPVFSSGLGDLEPAGFRQEGPRFSEWVAQLSISVPERN